MFGKNGTTQDDPRGLLHLSSDPQPFDFCFLSQDVRHSVVHNFHREWIHLDISGVEFLFTIV